MNVASKDLSEELYKLSGWDDVSLSHYQAIDRRNMTYHWSVTNTHAARGASNSDRPAIPAYDLGYLLRKLPEFLDLRQELDVGKYGVNGVWVAEYWGNLSKKDCGHAVGISADSVENAAAKLAIELFEDGILTKEVEEV